MNKLEIYKHEEVTELAKKAKDVKHAPAIIIGFAEGFDCYNKLKLPIKFAKWIASHDNDKTKDKMWKDSGASNMDELFDYWINNILSI